MSYINDFIIEYGVLVKYNGRNTDVNIPDDGSVTAIGSRCFEACDEIKSIKIPDSVNSFGDWCFAACKKLRSITIPASVISLGKFSFYLCENLESITVEKGNPVYHSAGNCVIENDTGKLVVGCKTSIIPDDGSVISLGDRCFAGCNGLRNITLPTSITSLGEACFFSCINLKSIIIPASIKSLGDRCFSYCSNLKEIVVEEGNSVYFATNNCVIETKTGKLVVGCKTSIIPDDDSIFSLGEYCFAGCKGLKKITIPSSVTDLGKSCFYGCTQLEVVTIPDSLTSFGKCCFSDCKKLIIYAKKGTAAAKYAVDNGIKLKLSTT